MSDYSGLKFVQCKDCGADECVPEDMPEPWICKDCQKLHKENAARDQEIENEIMQEAD